ncbi:hypothetical protein [Pedobacter metabolipauper]|uniref:Uncharacterized protein n=1 Tax=Pedobacter metabolipauper TaxID=425513 RepID=A0A4R6T3T2_9SPHI|nr:hypothetical protein [Pedobacter metabolipauper]TDQ12031.1 hypothetical protein ATK78_1162 [Pedobacter metabolipauper]
MIHLTIEQLKANLSLGKTVEQWLGYKDENSYTILKWISIEKEHHGEYSVAYIESFDEGNEDFIDIYEFSTLDPDEPLGIISTFSNIDEAIDFSLNEYGASVDKFVSGGMIQEEYLIYLNSKS